MDTSKEDWVYSADLCDWRQHFDSLEEITKYILDNEVAGTKVIIYRGQREYYSFEDYIQGDEVLQLMSDNALESEEGEYTGDYLLGVTPSQIKELEELIVDWGDRHGIIPDWFTVKEIEEVTSLTVPDP